MALAESTILSKLMQLARDMRRPRAYTGHSFFLCFALARERRPFAWEGRSRIDLIQTFAPWAEGKCTAPCVADAVSCCIFQTGTDVHMREVCDKHPLDHCNHWMGAVAMGSRVPAVAEPTIEGFYSNLGYALLETVCDGDCGVDVACQMLGLPQTFEERLRLREELQPWSIIITVFTARRMSNSVCADLRLLLKKPGWFLKSSEPR